MGDEIKKKKKKRKVSKRRCQLDIPEIISGLPNPITYITSKGKEEKRRYYESTITKAEGHLLGDRGLLKKTLEIESNEDLKNAAKETWCPRKDSAGHKEELSLREFAPVARSTPLRGLETGHLEGGRPNWIKCARSSRRSRGEKGSVNDRKRVITR